MATVHSLHIPECRKSPAHQHHPPPVDTPLRIHIQGPLVSVQRLLPNESWHVDQWNEEFPQPAGPKLAALTYRAVYGPNASPEVEKTLVLRDEYLGWVYRKNEIDYYGVTFDVNVPADDDFPEVFQVNMFEIESDNGEYVNEMLPFKIDPADYVGKKILGLPRCCQDRRGSKDRRRVNGLVAERDVLRQGMDLELMRKLLTGHGLYSTKPLEIRHDIVPRPPTGKDTSERDKHPVGYYVGL